MSTANVATYRIAGLAICSLLMSGCGGGGNHSTPLPPPTITNDASLSSLSATGATLVPAFSPSVTSYTATVPNSTNSVDVSVTTGDDDASFTINGSTNATIALVVGDNAIAIEVTAEDGTTTRTYTIVVTRHLTFAQEAYVKASNTDADDVFGYDVTLSDDGNTLAVGARFEEGAAIGVNGDQTDNSIPFAGAVYVFTRDSGGVWTQQAYVKASNTDADGFGTSVTLSDDGNTLAVGAVDEDSAATGVNGDQADNNAIAAGAVYVFTRDTGGVWTQQAYVKASNTDADDSFGVSVTLSDDGNTLAVGAGGEDSAATGVNGDQADNNAIAAGAVYVFTRGSGGVWTQQGYVKASNTESSDFFGGEIALSGDGNTLAVGADGESSAATGANGDQTDNSAQSAGAVYVFTRGSGGVWTQQAYVKASNTDADDSFGASVTLSDDGNTLAAGAPKEESAATGVNGDQTNDSVQFAGAVYVFTRGSGGVWMQHAYVKASNTDSDTFGLEIALSDDGNTLAVGARHESSAATGANGDQTDNSAESAGAVYVFTRGTGGVWTQQVYVKASNTDADDSFGISVTLSDDGNTLAAGAVWEDSAATGVNGDQADNNTLDAGAVYLFRRGQ